MEVRKITIELTNGIEASMWREDVSGVTARPRYHVDVRRAGVGGQGRRGHYLDAVEAFRAALNWLWALSGGGR